MPRLDLDHLARQTMNDPDLQRDVLRLFEQHMTQKIAELARGEGPVKMVAHSIKGSARGVGAIDVALLAEQLEVSGHADPARVKELEQAFADVMEDIRSLTHL